jgi:GrpB-like predicted nucleotidyltransferase (UPF0157 family)
MTEPQVPKPVAIADYDPRWPGKYAAERERILVAIGERALAIEHVGSTSVPGLAAKPTIDIMVGFASGAVAAECVSSLADLGYAYQPENAWEIPDWHYFDRTGDDGQRYHLHMVPMGGEFWQRHLAFRDYLRAHPEAAREYERLKRELAARYGSDRLGYCNAKTEFILGVERMALAWAAAKHGCEEAQ